MRCRRHAALCGRYVLSLRVADGLDNFALVGKAEDVLFRKDLLAIGFDIEYSTGAGDQFYVDVAKHLQFFRQTGGLRAVVSLIAVGDFNLHVQSPS